MPGRNRATDYTNRASIAGLGLLQNASKIKNAARKNLIRFDINKCEQEILKKASAIPHQYELLTSWETRYVGISGGFGCGKTFCMVAKQLLFCFRSPGTDHLFFEPSIPLLDDIAIPQFDQLLEEFNIPHSFRRTPRPYYSLHLPGGDTRILLRSIENWEKIVGVNAASCVMDEIDTIKNSIVQRAIINIQGRARIGKCKQQFAFGSTPEGYNFMYDFFMTQPDKTEEDSVEQNGAEFIEAEDRKLIFGKSEDNPYVRKDYIEDIKKQYSVNIAKAYLTGKFVNLKTVRVFSEYDRDIHNSDVFMPDQNDIILFGADFNLKDGRSVYAVIRVEQQQQVLHVFLEHTARDTYALAEFVKKQFAKQLFHSKVICYPDATGQREYTSSTESDHDILRNVGIQVIPAGGRNVAIPAIVGHVNNSLHRKLVKINKSTCSDLVRACEQWGYDENTQRPAKGGIVDHSNIGDAFKYLVWGAVSRPNSSVGHGRRWR